MVEIAKYVEDVKMKTLYEARETSRLSKDVLEQWDTNKRLNAKMARLTISGEKVCSTFQGVFAEKLGDILGGVVTAYRSVDGWSVTRAIEAEGQTVAKEGEVKKKGILGKLGL